MNRIQLEHIIRASAANADTREVIVVGSQAILGAFPEAPAELLLSMEADVFPKERPADSILIDGAIGENSVFHETYGYYAHGVDESTAILPAGWRDRLVRIENENTRGYVGWCLEPHDLAASKLAAGREKDLSWLAALLAHRLISPAVFRQRASALPIADEPGRLAISARLDRLLANT